MESRAPLDVLSGLLVHAGLEGDRRVLRRRDLARAGGRQRGDEDPVRGARRSSTIGPEVKFAYRVDTSATFTAHADPRRRCRRPTARRIAFTALDRLYVTDAAGGTPRRVTTTDVGEYHPTWSPDGTVARVRPPGTITPAARSCGPPAGGGRTPRLRSSRSAAASTNRPRLVARRAAHRGDPRCGARDLKEATSAFSDRLAAEFVWVPADGRRHHGDRAHWRPRHVPHFTATPPDLRLRSGRDGLVSSAGTAPT